MKNIVNQIPYKATHPGEVLKDELEARNINQKDFAVELDIHKTILNEIIKGKRSITADVALLLEKSLEISADYWLRFQSQYELDLARIKDRNIQKIINIEVWKIIKQFVPISYFKKIGYFIDDLKLDIAKVKEVYGISNVEDLVELSANYKYSYFKKSEKLKINDNNILAWNVVAKYEAKNQIVNTFNPENIPTLIKELQTIFYDNSDTIRKTKVKLNQYGIKFVLVQKLEQTPIDGYTFWSGNNPTIALTLRHSRIDNFAFTIMHELGHIALHFKGDKEQQFFDLTIKSSHLDRIENEANEYANDNLIAKPIWAKIINHYDFSDDIILNYSRENKINPAIIRGRISHENKQYAVITSIDKKLY